MQCISKRSANCTGEISHSIWDGMCSNCADLASRKKKPSALSNTTEDWREGLKELETPPDAEDN